MASTLSFRAAVTFVVIGMSWGLVMAASGDHSTLAGHAHLNLLGWVSCSSSASSTTSTRR